MGFLASAIAVGISAVASAYAAYAQGQQQSALASYNRKIALNQEQLAKNAAAAAAEDKREQLRNLLAVQRARAGASGVLPDEGSPFLVQLQSEEQGLLDIARIRYSGQRQAEAFESEATLQAYLGRQARRAGALRAGITLVGGATDAYLVGSRRGTQPTPPTTTRPGYGESSERYGP